MRLGKVDTTPFQPDLTPLVDLILILLLFFVVAIGFENTQADERARLPAGQLARPPQPPTAGELLLTLAADPTGGGRILVTYNGRTFEVSRMLPELQNAAAQFQPADGKSARPQATVVIRGAPEIPTGIVQELIMLCQQAGFETFALKSLQSP